MRRGGPGCDKLLDEVRQRIPGALQDLFTRNVENFSSFGAESPSNFECLQEQIDVCNHEAIVIAIC